MIATVTPTELLPASPAETTPVTAPQPAMPSLVRWRLTTAQFERMGATGILDEDDRVELIEGELIAMCALGSRHVSCVNELNAFFLEQLGRRVVVSIQNALQVNEYTAPQPDVLVLRPRADRYAESLATAADVLLLIEVADSSLAQDRRVKLPLYAQAAIPEVWIINLGAKSVEQYTEPANGAYKTLRTIEHDAAITPTLLPGLTLAVADFIA
ncbi:MAG: Uma2 family endonuclease [Chloroflexota bacterium]|nr:Uma2 family endonuclease [Chloroflexota bacterium]